MGCVKKDSIWKSLLYDSPDACRKKGMEVLFRFIHDYKGLCLGV